MKYRCEFCGAESDFPTHDTDRDGDNWAELHNFIGEYLYRPSTPGYIGWRWDEI